MSHGDSDSDRARRVYRFMRYLAVIMLAVALVLGGWVFVGRELFVTSRRAVQPAAQSGAPVGAAVAALSGELRSLALTPADGEMYVATATGVYHSPDDGAHWTALTLPIEPGPGGVADVVVNPRAPATVYVTGDGLGVLRSDDGGSTWTSLAGLPHDRVRALAMHTYNFDTLYAYLQDDKRVYETRDGGLSWREPVGGPPVEAVALGHSVLPGSMNTGWLYAATAEGLYLSMD